MVFTLQQALQAQTALREAAALPPEVFPLPAFIGMVSDEIEALRNRGKADEEIASMINTASGSQVSAADINEHYASAEQRERGGR